ncbi:glycosyltransferase family protein [Pseudonocardia phyllosphaerae]|uniref:hypothetical protein n=1 Tax=Pseudonocardia phyllosphaerae TaxID=3390502 RepID=UPI00397DE9D7
MFMQVIRCLVARVAGLLSPLLVRRGSTDGRVADTRTHSGGVAVLETEPEGHRLQYLGHLVRAAGPGHSVVITGREASESDEFRTYLGPETQTVLLPPNTSATMSAAIGAAVDSGMGTLVVPDADRHLAAVLWLLIRSPALPLEIRLLVMRTPEIGGPERLRPAMLAKPLLVQLLRTFPQVRVSFLTDAFGIVARRRGYPGVLGLPDPVVVTDEPALQPPDWLPPADPEAVRVGVLGVIGARKNLPLLVEAATVDPSLRIVAAGRLDPEIREYTGTPPAQALREAGRLVLVDRLLSPEEFAAALNHLDVAAVLHDNDAPSGILAEASLRGTPVIVTDGGWLARVVRSTGIGAVAGLDARSVAAAARVVGSNRNHYSAVARARAVALGTSAFTDGLLGR